MAEDERVRKYADAMEGLEVWVGFRDDAGDDDGAYGTVALEDLRTLARAVMVVADEEQAELRETLATVVNSLQVFVAKAAALEAKPARVEAALDEWEASYGVKPLPEHWGITARIAQIRAALEGPDVTPAE